MLKPDGVTVVAGPICAGISGSISNVTIPANGLYQVKIDPVGNAATRSTSISKWEPSYACTIDPNGTATGKASVKLT